MLLEKKGTLGEKKLENRKPVRNDVQWKFTKQPRGPEQKQRSGTTRGLESKLFSRLNQWGFFTHQLCRTKERNESKIRSDFVYCVVAGATGK